MANGTTDQAAAHPTEAEGVAREPLVLNNRSMSWITDRICGIVENRQPLVWWFLFVPAVFLASCLFFTLVYLVSTGVGIWGNNQPVAWGWAIVNFVFWIGIGHAGTLISAILFLTRQRWRTSVNRSAEAMTLFAVICAGIFPGFPCRPFLDGLVPGADSECQCHLAELQESAALGRVRRWNLLHGVGDLLVHRPDP